MKVGDLIKEKIYPEIGVIVEIAMRAVVPEGADMTFVRYPPPDQKVYAVLCPNGKIEWFGQTYIEEECEVINESR
tara:strand:+ start:2354 stop:2578 length:225 start_codon:yes stop_codon:yes gene_type:complete